MSNVVKWFKSGGVVLTDFKSLTGEEDADEHETLQDDGSDTTPKTDRGHAAAAADIPDVYTVEDAVDKMGFGLFQILLSMFAGSIWMVEAFEVMILSILSGALKCQWKLSYAQEASITTVVFFGFLVGGTVWGITADKFGRKRTLLVVLILGFVFGIASAFSPNYYVILLIRGLVGFGFGGGFLGPAYCAEFLPARSRAVIMCLLEIAWAVGSVVEALLALVVMTSIDHEPWRWLLGFSALPVLLVILVFPLIPESPRYLIFKGQEEKAKKVLSLIAKVNCKQLPDGRLVTAEEKEKLLKERSPLPDEITVSTTTMLDDEAETKEISGTLPNMDSNDLTVISSDNDSDSELLLDEHTQRRKQIINKLVNYYHWILILFKNGWWRTTLLLWYLWFAANIIYYGGTLLTTSLFQHDEHCGLKGNDSDVDCKVLTKSDYIHIVWTTCAEFPGTAWIIVLLLLIGRKKSMAITTLAAAIFYGLLFLCLDKVVLTVFLFGVRGFATGFFQAIYLYTPEVYPTAVRAFGMSLCASISRVGGMITPYIAQTLLAYSSVATISLFIVFSLSSSVASLLLPIETRGRPMKDTGG
ncbi:putative transporter svop-1 [Dysidea avara]|uniref:putative transporter svop-1 n=1 Tax=Dysidea avara TaxID=196820 RepID=UPI00331DE0B2